MGIPELASRGQSAQPADGKALQPTITGQSKATEAGKNNQLPAMATIADDDDRLLVRIGYAPVSTMSTCWFQLQLTQLAGPSKTFLKMVNSLICYFHSWCAGLSSCYFWRSNVLGRPSNRSLGLVHWQHHGLLYSQLRYTWFHPVFAPL